MKILQYIYIVGIGILLLAQGRAQTAMGTWRDHFSYNKAIQVLEAGNRIYAATEDALIFFDKADNSINRLSKVEGLTESKIACIGFNEQYNTLIIAYENSNIDLLQNGQITNLPALKEKTLSSGKHINQIFTYGPHTLLACDFGILQLNLEKRRVEETWYIGNEGGVQSVVSMAAWHDTLFVSTPSEIRYANLNDPNLYDYRNWKTAANTPLSAGKLRLLRTDNRLYIHTFGVPDSIFVKNNSGWQYLDIKNTDHWDYLSASRDKLICGSWGHNYIYSESGAVIDSVNWWYDDKHSIIAARDALYDSDGIYWFADGTNGLIGRRIKEYISYPACPNGPSASSLYRMIFANGKMVAARGTILGYSGKAYDQPMYATFQDDSWTSHELPSGSCFDLIGAAVMGEKTYVASFGDGLFEFTNNELTKNYNPTNSILPAALEDNTCLLCDIKADKDGNVWMLSSGVSNNLIVKQANGDWKAYNLGSTALGRFIVDSRGTKWATFFDSPNIVAFHESKGKKTLNLNVGLDEKASRALSVAEDMSGYIWVGTDKGVRVYYNPSQVFTATIQPQMIVVEEGNGLYNYLLVNEYVSVIKVDGGNRKWIGTESSGVYLISEDGKEELHHFTADNSPLPSDRITDIAINDETGEVFFLTDKGTVSFMSNASAGKTVKTIKVYPNPVKPDFGGVVSFLGMQHNSDVRVTTAAGELIYKTRSIGGTATWNRCLPNGDKAASGVYLVWSVDENGNAAMGKFVLIND